MTYKIIISHTLLVFPNSSENKESIVKIQENKTEKSCSPIALVTQPMIQRRPNPTELRSISKFYLDSKKVREKFLYRPPSVLKNHPLPQKGRFFSSLM